MPNDNSNLINVISSDGVEGTIPADKVNEAVVQTGQFKLAPSSPIEPIDLSPDGQINVVSLDGTEGTVPPDKLSVALRSKQWGDDPEDQGGGFILKSTAERQKDSRYQTNNKGILNSSDPEHAHDLYYLHENDDVLDEHNNFKMVKNGNYFSIPETHLAQARAAGFKFADPNFQALIDAKKDLEKENNYDAVGQKITAQGAASGLTFGLSDYATKVGQSLSNPKKNNVDRAYAIAWNELYNDDEFKGAKTIGNVIGSAATLLAPEGIVGEVGLAGKTLEAVKTAEVLKEAPILGSVLGHAAQGMVIAAPQVASALIQQNPKLAAESLALGALGGVVLGELPNVINAVTSKVSQYAGERLSGLADKALSSMGASPESELLKLDNQAKQKIVDVLIESGLKESSTAEKTISVLNDVSSGSKISSLSKLDEIGESIETNKLLDNLMTTARGEKGLDMISPELEQSLSVINRKLNKLDGSASLAELQAIASEIKMSGAPNDVLNFNSQAKSLIMNEIYQAGDQAVLKADPKTLALWSEQKSIAQAADEMQGYFANKQAELSQGAEPSSNGLLKDLLLATTGKIPGARVLSQIQGKGRLPNYSDVVLEHGKDFLQKFLGSSESKGKSWLLKNADNPNISSYLTMNAIHNTNFNLSQIPEYLKNPTIKSALFVADSNPIKSLLGEQSNGLSKAQQYDRLSDKFSLLAGNDQLKKQYLDNAASIVAKNHPELADQFKMELSNKIDAANSLLSQGNKEGPSAFQKTQNYYPSKDKMAQLESGLNAIQNPYSILAGLATGKVSSKDVALVQQLHPAIYQEIVSKINQEAFSGKASPLTYQDRLSMSIITQQPLDKSLKIGSALQNSYDGSAASAASSGKQKVSSGKKNLHADKISSYTPAQRMNKV